MLIIYMDETPIMARKKKKNFGTLKYYYKYNSKTNFF